MSSRRVSWIVMGLVLVVALAIGTTGDAGAQTEAERVRAIASTVRCPTCKGLSAAESDAKAATAVRAEIARRVRAGESAGHIRAFLVSRYGRDILLTPEGRGLPALVWAIPVAGLLLGGLGIGLALRQWRARMMGVPTPEDETLVAAARGKE